MRAGCSSEACVRRIVVGLSTAATVFAAGIVPARVHGETIVPKPVEPPPPIVPVVVAQAPSPPQPAPSPSQPAPSPPRPAPSSSEPSSPEPASSPLGPPSPPTRPPDPPDNSPGGFYGDSCRFNKDCLNGWLRYYGAWEDIAIERANGELLGAIQNAKGEVGQELRELEALEAKYLFQPTAADIHPVSGLVPDAISGGDLGDEPLTAQGYTSVSDEPCPGTDFGPQMVSWYIETGADPACR